MTTILNELVIAGFLAILFKIILGSSSSTVPPEWVFALEYADIVVPLTVFMHCFQGAILIVYSSFITDQVLF